MKVKAHTTVELPVYAVRIAWADVWMAVRAEDGRVLALNVADRYIQADRQDFTDKVTHTGRYELRDLEGRVLVTRTGFVPAWVPNTWGTRLALLVRDGYVSNWENWFNVNTLEADLCKWTS